METSKPLMKDENAEDVDVHLHRSMIGSLMYLTSSRPDIIYLKGQPKLGLWYPKDSPFDLEAYIDSDYVGASLDRKSTTRGELSDSVRKRIERYMRIKTERELVSIKIDDGNAFWNEIRRNAGDSVNAARHTLTTASGEGSVMPNVPQHTPTINPPSTSKPQKKQSRRKQRKDTKVSQPSNPTEPMTYETENVESVPTHSNDLLFSGEDRLQLKELLELCTKLSERVLDLENTKTSQAAKITKLKEREDAFKQGRKIVDLDADADVTLVDEAQGRNDDYLMFDTRVFDEHEVEVKKAVSTAEVTTVSATTTTIDEPKARGVVVQEPSEFRTTTSSQLPHAKDKDKAKTIQPEKPLKKKDQILINEEIAQKLQAQLNAELEEEEKLAKQREEDANIAKWDNVQAMIHADYELAARLQAQEHEELIVEEKSKLFVELMDKRKKHFARLRAEEQRRKPPTKAQKRNQICTNLNNMAGFTHMVKGGKEKDEGSVTRAEERSSKRAGIELEQERIKKQKIDDDQE
ncbi:hypothetical protein Tco_0741402 [Tanacetum coccineum]